MTWFVCSCHGLLYFLERVKTRLSSPSIRRSLLIDASTPAIANEIIINVSSRRHNRPRVDLTYLNGERNIREPRCTITPWRGGLFTRVLRSIDFLTRKRLVTSFPLFHWSNGKANRELPRFHLATMVLEGNFEILLGVI